MAQPSTQQLLDAGHATEYFWYAQGSGIFDARNNAMLTKTGSAGMAVESGANVALGDGATHYSLPSSINIAQPWTIIFRVRSGAVATTDTMVCGDTATSSDFVRLMLDTSQVRILAAGSQVSWTPQTITALTTWAMVSSGTTVTLYKDGVAQGAAKTISGTAPIKINRLMDGYPGGTFRLKGALEFVNVVPSALDAAAIASRNADPYAVLASAGTTIAATVGTATASGFAAAIIGAVTIACSLGGATASGHQASISTGSNVTVSTTIGTATASGYTASVVSAGSATITTDVFKNNTGTVLASTIIPKLAAIKLSDMTVAASWTSQATNGSGILSLTGAMTAATDYLLVVSSADGAAVGVKKYTAT